MKLLIKKFEKIFNKNFKKVLTNNRKFSRILLVSYRQTKWSPSSAGRASALQAGGHRFEPYSDHHFWPGSSVG